MRTGLATRDDDPGGPGAAGAARLPAVADAVAAAELEELEELARAAAYERASLAPGTLEKYATAWADFLDFCARRGLASLPADPSTVARYLAQLADRRYAVTTIRLRLAAIGRAHTAAGFAAPTGDPQLRTVLRGITRTLGVAPRRRVDALRDDLVRRLVRVSAGDVAGNGTAESGADGHALIALRDRALVLLGFALGCRRSELVALDVADLRSTERGVTVTIRRSKTDQEGAAHLVGIPRLPRDPELCAVRALGEWLVAASIVEGAIFRSFSRARGSRSHGALGTTRLAARDVARIVQRLAREAELDGDFAAHSLRAGFITSADAAGVPLHRSMRITGHRSARIAESYVRRESLYEDAPLAAISNHLRTKSTRQPRLR